MTPAESWAILCPEIPYSDQAVRALVRAEEYDALHNYRAGWHALAACGINPDNPHDRHQLAAGAAELAALCPCPEHQAFALTVAKMCSDVTGGALWQS